MNISPFKLSIEELLKTRGKSFNYHISGRLDDEEDVKFTEPIEVGLDLVEVDGKVVVSGELKTEIGLICSRCGKEFRQNVGLKFEIIFGDDGEDLIIENDSSIDIEPAIREEILLSLPIKRLCKNNCKGVTNATA